MANDTDDEFSGFSSDDFSEFFDEPQESSSVSEVPGSQERPPLREETGEDDDDDGELNELAGTGAGTVARLNPEMRGMIMSQANSRAWTRHERHVVMRRALSMGKLEELIDWYPRPGQSIHILSCGEIDLFSYLHFMLRQRPYAYILISTFSLGYGNSRPARLSGKGRDWAAGCVREKHLPQPDYSDAGIRCAGCFTQKISALFLRAGECSRENHCRNRPRTGGGRFCCGGQRQRQPELPH